MLNNSDIEKYRSIKAPEELKFRVLEQGCASRPKRKILNIRTISAIAACFLVLLVCIPFLNNTPSPATVTMKEFDFLSNYPRMVGSVIIVIESEGKINVSTKDDSFYYFAEDNEQPIALKELKGVKNKLEIGWYVSFDTSYFEVNGETYKVSYEYGSIQPIVEKIK